MRKVILYARIQTQNEVSRLRSQIDEMTAFCQKNNLEVVAAYCDIAHGATFERVKFQTMLNDIEDQRVKADLILFTTWDRFARYIPAALEMIKTLRAMGLKAQSLQDFERTTFEILLMHM